jgi:chromosome segregation ATPase
MTIEAPLPPVAEIVVELERALSGQRRVSPDALVALLLELHDSNLRQWDLEDVTRVSEASDSAIADAKRAIDKLNLTRHHLIEEIDSVVHASLKQSTTAPFATESPGMVFDRLSVLVIRIARTAEKARSSREEAERYAGRLASLQRQLAALAAALESLLRDVRAGARRFLPYEHLKLYAAQPGASRRGTADSSPG